MNLARIRFPIGAIASIGHRVSGVVLFVVVPLCAFALDRSLESEAGFQALHECVSARSRVLILVGVVWAATHHVLAGIRHLLMDAGVGSGLAQARVSAWGVIFGGIVAALAAAIGWVA